MQTSHKIVLYDWIPWALNVLGVCWGGDFGIWGCDIMTLDALLLDGFPVFMLEPGRHSPLLFVIIPYVIGATSTLG